MHVTCDAHKCALGRGYAGHGAGSGANMRVSRCGGGVGGEERAQKLGFKHKWAEEHLEA